MSATQTPTLDMDKLNQFVGQFVTDLGATVHAGLVVIGEKLGLYKALATGADDFRRTRQANQYRRALRARMAVFASGRWLRHV